MQYFYINKNSTLNSLRLELVNDGRYEFLKKDKFNAQLQNADITFSMWDENNNLKISKAPCNIVLSEAGGCEDNYIIEYRWKKRDTNTPGVYKGRITIEFKDDLYEESSRHEGGTLIVPIYEDLRIQVLD